jgi:2',3'-cyclic-nucleotide 2'-phosphodiesterase/3'-nucleotidase/5'-nucleotidase
MTARTGLLTTAIALLPLFSTIGMAAPTWANNAVELEVVSTYQNGTFGAGAAEIAAYDARSQQIFITNAESNTIDRLYIGNPNRPVLKGSIDLSPYGGGVNSVATDGSGLIAVAVEADNKQAPGSVVFFTTNGRFMSRVTVGALPDMVTFTPDGTRVLVANEGEPSDDYTVDPEGSISIISLTNGILSLQEEDVQTVTFRGFSPQQLRLRGVRIFGPQATVAQDLEPEYIAVSADSQKAFVTLQENNAVAVIDILDAKVLDILPLGAKNHGIDINALDASDEDGGIYLSTYPVLGLYLPDAIATLNSNETTYFLVANEGDSRDYDSFSEEARVADLTLDSTAFPNMRELQQASALGRLKVTTTLGDTDNDGDFDALYAFGGRSFSIWREDGTLVWDSGNDFERILAEQLPNAFNSTNDESNSFDDRSDDKGPEPEGITLGNIGEQTYAFIGLERVGGVMVYDITDLTTPTFVTYANNRNFTGDPTTGAAGDLAPEGLLFISADDSPNGSPLLVVTNEVSSTTTIYSLASLR